jgi:hypothetical protein
MWKFTLEKTGKKPSTTSNDKEKKQSLSDRIPNRYRKLLLTIILLVSILLYHFQLQPKGLVNIVVVGLAWALTYFLAEKIWETLLTSRNLSPSEFSNEERFNYYEKKGYSESKCRSLVDLDRLEFDNKKGRGTRLSQAMRIGISIIIALLSVYAIKVTGMF